jgi:hypothetical protein
MPARALTWNADGTIPPSIASALASFALLEDAPLRWFVGTLCRLIAVNLPPVLHA